MYEGYLLKIGDTKFPMNRIAANTYRAKPHQRLELDAYRNNLGELERDVAENEPTLITFNLEDGLTNTEVKGLTDIFRAAYVNKKERKVLVTYYDPETDSYPEAEYMHWGDTEYPIDYIDGYVIYYDAISIKLTGY